MEYSAREPRADAPAPQQKADVFSRADQLQDYLTALPGVHTAAVYAHL